MKKSIGKKVLTMALALGVVCSLDGCMGNNSWMGSTEWTETMTEAATETGTAAQASDTEAMAETGTAAQASDTEEAAQADNSEAAGSETAAQTESGEEEMQTIHITIGGKTFDATLYDNETARTFAESLPMTVNMSELNGNEKYYYMPDSLSMRSETPGQIQAGDLMLFGSDCLVLFYETFSTSYSYTPLGRIDNAEGLAEAVGRGSVEVTFEIQ